MEVNKNAFVRSSWGRRIKAPYILFLGAEQDLTSVKTATGVYHWRPENCQAQLRLPGCKVDLGLPEVAVTNLAQFKGHTLIIGVAPEGGIVKDNWLSVLKEALRAGLDIASGLHTPLSQIPSLAQCAHDHGCQLHDVRVPDQSYDVGTGISRSGKRLLTVGTDCAVGKMFTALAIEQAMNHRGMSTKFRATGQTGILITGEGVPLDAVVADFISGAIESLSPAFASDHWDIIEGQGSLFHPAYAGVTLGLVHGSQPDAMVLCHDASLLHMDGLPEYPIPEFETCLETYLTAAKLTNPRAKFVGVSVNTSRLQEKEASSYLENLEKRLALPCCDPIRTGVARILDELTR